MPVARRPPADYIDEAASIVEVVLPDAVLPLVDDDPDPGSVGFAVGTALALYNDGGTLVYRRCGATEATGLTATFYGFLQENNGAGAEPRVASTRGAFVTPLVEGGGNLTPNEPVYLARTEGMVTQDVGSFQSGDRVLRVGTALSATQMLFTTDWHYGV